MFIAAFMSLSWWEPHFGHVHCLSVREEFRCDTRNRNKVLLSQSIARLERTHVYVYYTWTSISQETNRRQGQRLYVPKVFSYRQGSAFRLRWRQTFGKGRWQVSNASLYVGC